MIQSTSSRHSLTIPELYVFLNSISFNLLYYLHYHLASESIVMIGVTMCASARLVSAAMVMHCIQCSQSVCIGVAEIFRFVVGNLMCYFKIVISCIGYYICQVNKVNGGDTVFVRCVSVCVQWTSQSDQFKMVKAKDFRFDMHVPGTVWT